MRILAGSCVAAGLLGAAAPCWSNAAGDDADVPPPPTPIEVPQGPMPVEAAPPSGLARWFNPATAPFIPVPLISTDPNSGSTFGLIPTWVKTDENHDVSRIIAPDVLVNENFGVGVHARIYAYSSADEQWSMVAGIKERVEREFDFEYENGRSRQELWSIKYSLIYDRDGTPRFYGIGNDTPLSQQTNYTNQQEFGRVQIGLNITHTWQLQYTLQYQTVDVLPGTLADIPSIQTLFPTVYGLGTNSQLLNRLAVVYDTRDDQTIPTKGNMWVVYGGAAAKNGLFNDSSYSEYGVDGRGFWPVAPDTELVAHMALRYLPGSGQVPFWALSSLGGSESQVGGEQPLRGFGAGRYYDRDSFSTSVELRRKVYSLNAVTTKLDIEVAPFVDLGRVFGRTSSAPLDQLHQVYGVGFRGIARPYVVGYVDVGHGSEGAAVFTGLNYPF
ncbi:MAG: BamA/TamA family outer membrane protein [Steroidobacteraceae bacterium]